jgi:hypothetical protein
MWRIVAIGASIGLLVTIAGCGGGEETLMTEFADVPSSVGIVKARVENRIRETNGPFAADCRRAPHPEAEGGEEFWNCRLITDFGGFKVQAKLLVDPSDGSYSILRCQGKHAPIGTCERIH